MKRFLKIICMAVAFALTLFFMSKLIPQKKLDSSAPASTEDENHTSPSCIHNYTNGVCSLCGDDDPDYTPLFDIAGSSVTMESDLTMYFYVKTWDISGEDYTALITKETDGGVRTTISVPFDQWDLYYGLLYQFEVKGISAKEMADKIEVTICNSAGVQVSNTWTDSIRDYAVRQLENGSQSAAYTVLVDMLNYGAAAQVQFAYNTDDLANSTLTSEQASYATQDFDMDNYSVNTVWGEGFVGSSLSLESNIILTMYFSPLAEISGDDLLAEVSYTDHTGRFHCVCVSKSEFVKMGSDFGVVIDTLTAADVRQLVSVVIYDGGTSVAFGADSVESYAVRQGGELLETMMKFSMSAYEFLNGSEMEDPGL